MRKGMVFAAASVLAYVFGTANAAGLSGAIEEVDRELNTILVRGMTFAVSPSSTVI